MDRVFVIYVEHNNKKYLYDIGDDPEETERTARIMTATDPIFTYHTMELPYVEYLKMIRKSRADKITVCSLIEAYINE